MGQTRYKHKARTLKATLLNFCDMANQVVKVRRDEIASCMTCPLCNNLFKEATTIIECLHTCEYFVFLLSFQSAFVNSSNSQSFGHFSLSAILMGWAIGNLMLL